MSVPPPQMPYGAPPPADSSNPYAFGNPYGGPAPAPAAPAPGAPGYGYPAAPQQAAPGYGVPPQAAPPGYGYPQQAGYAQQAPHGGPVCRFCGGFPAVDTTVRGHQGIIIVMRFLKQPGPFCRTCGTAVVRDMSARTLVQGWWGYLSSIITPITLLRNLAAHNKIKDLPPPAPGTHGPQLDPGVPLTKRPHMLMLLLPVLSITSFIILVTTGALLGATDHDSRPYRPISLPSPTAVTFPPIPSFSMPPIPEITTPGAAKPSAPAVPSTVPSDIDRAKAGDCLRNENGTSATHDPNPRITMLPCSDSRAQYKVLRKLLATSDDKGCDNVPESDSSYTRTSSSEALSYVLCLKAVNG
ncbi:hypothetical protein RMN57_20035 [Kitasatospora sp. CM 4170]|uniref:Toxin-antitoxin system, toxin component n=1 Tax=Kitasatospora aburaviensis TaxID=67265 RepID=A0ABW1FAG9_9ACTN|nr:hypothetical protein [Kitasatospora sp. CM 4170]WNM46826.1 hypothetical protein RMN57_20035 [Kitasatospora sp. CM 4170]